MRTSIEMKLLPTMCFLAFLLSGMLVAQEAPKMKTGVFDLRCFGNTLNGEVATSTALPLSASLQSDSPEEHRRQTQGMRLENRDFGIDYITEVARMIVSQYPGGDEYSEIDVDNATLIARVPEPALERIASIIKYLEDVVTRSATIEIVVLEANALKDANPGLLSADETKELLKSAATNQRLRAVVNLGQMTRLNASRLRQYIRDYDVEVAKKSKMADPVVASLFEGIEAGVQLNEAPDGRFVLRIKGRTSHRIGKDRLVRTPARDIGALELPTTASSVAAMSVVIEAGKSFVMGSHESSNHPWLVRLIRVDPKPQSKFLPYISTSAINRQTFLPATSNVIGPRPSGGDGIIDEEDSDDCILSSDLFMQSISRMWETLGDEGNDRRVMETNGKLFYQGPENLKPQMDKMIAKYTAPLFRNVTTEVRYDLIENEALSEVLELTPEAMSKRLNRAARTIARTGSCAMAVSGREWLAIQDKNVEIAEDASISDPVVDALFEGLSMQVRPAIMSSGRIAMAVDFTFQLDTKRGRTIDTGRPEIGTIDADDLSHVVGQVRYKAENGKWTMLRVAPVPGTHRTLVMVARATH